jgi:hypothetical protein
MFTLRVRPPRQAPKGTPNLARLVVIEHSVSSQKVAKLQAKVKENLNE